MGMPCSWCGPALQQLRLPSSPRSPQITYRSTSDNQVKEGKAGAPTWRSSPAEQNLLPRNSIWHTDSFETTVWREQLYHTRGPRTTTDHKQLLLDSMIAFQAEDRPC